MIEDKIDGVIFDLPFEDKVKCWDLIDELVKERMIQSDIDNVITKEELNNKFSHYLTVGRLKEFIAKYNLPEDSKVMVQRIEDVYYKEHGWGVYLKEGEHTFEDFDGNIVKSSMEQYHPAWSCVEYKDEGNVLFIDLHY